MIRGSWIFSFIPEHERKEEIIGSRGRGAEIWNGQTPPPFYSAPEFRASENSKNSHRNVAQIPSSNEILPPVLDSQTRNLREQKVLLPRCIEKKKHRNEQILHRETNDQNQIFIILLPRKNPKNKNGSVTEIKRSDRDASINHGGTEQIHHITEREREKDMIVLMGLYL